MQDGNIRVGILSDDAGLGDSAVGQLDSEWNRRRDHVLVVTMVPVPLTMTPDPKLRSTRCR